MARDTGGRAKRLHDGQCHTLPFVLLVTAVLCLSLIPVLYDMEPFLNGSSVAFLSTLIFNHLESTCTFQWQQNSAF